MPATHPHHLPDTLPPTPSTCYHTVLHVVGMDGCKESGVPSTYCTAATWPRCTQPALHAASTQRPTAPPVRARRTASLSTRASIPGGATFQIPTTQCRRTHPAPGAVTATSTSRMAATEPARPHTHSRTQAKPQSDRTQQIPGPFLYSEFAGKATSHRWPQHAYTRSQ